MIRMCPVETTKEANIRNYEREKRRKKLERKKVYKFRKSILKKV